MARSRTRRRRQTFALGCALAVTVGVVFFSRDVARVAHSSAAAVTAQNLSFATMANDVTSEENSLDAGLTALLTTGASDDRQRFDDALTGLSLRLAPLATAAQLAATPDLTPPLNKTFATLTLARVTADRTVMATVARALALPWTPSPESLSTAQAALVSTTQTWNRAISSFERAPGRAQVDALTDTTGALDLVAQLAVLQSSSPLVLHRGIALSAVQVSPAPLPAPVGTLKLIPTNSVHLALSVSNESFATQPVSVVVTLTSASGGVQRRTASAVLGPFASTALTFASFDVIDNEHATLQVVVSGAPPAPHHVSARSFAVVVAPPG